MKKLLTGLFLSCFVGLFSLASSQESPGKSIFIKQKCNLCHSVSNRGIEARTKSERLKGPDLVNLSGKKYRPRRVGRYLKKKAKINGRLHKTSFKGTDEELQTVVLWLFKQ